MFSIPSHGTGVNSPPEPPNSVRVGPTTVHLWPVTWQGDASSDEDRGEQRVLHGDHANEAAKARDDVDREHEVALRQQVQVSP